MSKIIQLTQGQVAIVDDDDFERINQWQWCFDSGTGYAVRGAWVDGRTVKKYMHRVITETRKGQIVDHTNHDKLDNRRCNLSVGTQADNMANRRTNFRPGFSSIYRGVNLREERARHLEKPWVAGLRGKYVGIAATEEEAAKLYDLAALRYWGPSAQLNFPIDGLEVL